MNYKLSRYTYLFVSSKNKYLAYNSRTNSFLELAADLFHLLKKRANEENIMERLNSETFSVLVNSKMIVKEYEDDEFVSRLQYMTEKSTYAAKVLALTLLPTIDCNFACGYCFEENKQGLTMSEKTINSLTSFLQKQSDTNKLNLCWYGGEPLLAFDVIKKILAQIHSETNFKLVNHSLITNGYYFNQEVVDFFLEYPLNLIQITLDGNRERHNDFRKDKQTGAPTFDTIIENIDRITNTLHETNISLRINIEKNNIQDYYEVSRELKQRWQGKKVYIYPGFLRIENENKTAMSCNSLKQKEIAEMVFDLKCEDLLHWTLYPRKNNNKTCSATGTNSFLIGPVGEIYKCLCDVSNPDKVIGNINTEKITNPTVYYQYIVESKWYQQATCRKCFFLPICDGGCAYYVLRNKFENASFDTCSCIQKAPGMLKKCLEYYYDNEFAINN